jgi:Phytanoyl-CoA dioxygenase (PhyH)
MKAIREKLGSVRLEASLVKTFLEGYREFRRTGITPVSAYSSMRQLYWRTNGRFNDLATVILGLLNRPDGVAPRPGIFGIPDRAEVMHAAHNLRAQGYHVFDQRLPTQMCEELVAFARTTNGRPLITSTDQPAGSTSEYGEPAVFDETNPAHLAYYFDAKKVMATPAAQKIVSEPWFLNVAQEYLRCKPVNDLVVMWWSTAASKEPSSEAAQLYHFDMDWIKFVKFFVYLTDVTEDRGPHCYVNGSHLRKPKALLRDGRFQDEELKGYYAPTDFVEIVGPKGTMFAADTRGFHKGKPLLTGNRLIFQVEFAVSLFGQNYPSIEITDAFTPEFLDIITSYPYTFAKFVKQRG